MNCNEKYFKKNILIYIPFMFAISIKNDPVY